ncbi:helix-turn-helix domain-containing protein [Pengzhenrongella sicca]|uniref:Helix-turn-helix domain-containing protein n=1 Tax=Pengzhenrongella sicca TaxID=2819238 RepID=A0A8A4ZJ72_9MICO|nr:helix-turn-helix domain-containing protein [Pengzhenrongella sicca]QTE31083.1 helix-turn-helix domain-containing protein [Pengzhenrongella sicca]
MDCPGPLAEFLRAKRGDLSPARTQLAGYGDRRRVRGLRREEVAQLAGVSIGYYTRLEQGHSRHASDQVLLAIATALQLSVTETEHVLDLSKARVPLKGRAAPPLEIASAPALSMLAFITDRPAVLLGRRNDVLAWNPLGHALIAPHLRFSAPTIASERPSMARLLFLDPRSRALYPNWTKEAGDLVAYHRMISGKHPGDTALAALVGELVMKDPAFAALWAEGRVGECISGTKNFQHPVAGAFSARFDLWAQACHPEHRIEIYDPEDPDRVIPALRNVPASGLLGRDLAVSHYV